MLPKPIQVMLVDTPTLVRRCIATMLNRRHGIQIVGEVGSGTEARAAARVIQPEVIVMDPGVPDGGLNLVDDLSQRMPDCKVIVLTCGTGGSSVSRALQAGARGFLDKACEPDSLVRAIERVHRGELVVAAEATESIVRDLSRGPGGRGGSAGLSAREVEVLRLVAQGRSNPEIARELVITDHTVKAHLAKIQGKLGLENRVQLATYATQQGITDRPSVQPI